MMLTMRCMPRRMEDIMPKTPTSAPVFPVHPMCWPRASSIFVVIKIGPWMLVVKNIVSGFRQVIFVPSKMVPFVAGYARKQQ